MSKHGSFRLRMRRRAVSRVVTEVIMVVIVLGAAALVGLYFTGTLSSLIGGSNPVLMVEAASSSVNLGDGSGTVYFTLRNSGGGTLQLSSLTIDGKASITITGVSGVPHFKWGTNDIAGTFTATSAMAGVSGNTILIPSGQSTTLKFTFDTTHKLTDVMDIGVSYSGVAFPLNGNPIQFRFLLPSW
jgi:FlaG/FlaF family flagellin (archaellin)